MLFATVLKRVLWVLRYPSFSSDLVGPHAVGAIQTRIPGSVACQIHYPAAADAKRDAASSLPYFRPKAVEGIGDYSRTDPSILEFLSNRDHPCVIGADPLLNGEDGDDGFPIVVFSHGLGGCMEMYTELCRQIASQGFWVVALEHEDGSGAYAETRDGQPILYKRPDDTPYSRQKVTNFRRSFLKQRVEETTSALSYILSSSSSSKDESLDGQQLRKVMRAADKSRGVSLLGHSFGGASMIMTSREHLPNGAADDDDLPSTPSIQLSSLCVLDPWAFSLEDQVLKEGVPNLPTLSILSEGWLSNPETAQVRALLEKSGERVTSLYAPNSVHASFADSVGWLPGFVLRKMYMRGQKEKKHETARNVAVAYARHMRGAMHNGVSDTPSNADDHFSPLRPYPVAQVSSVGSSNPVLEEKPHEEPIDAY